MAWRELESQMGFAHLRNVRRAVLELPSAAQRTRAFSESDVHPRRDDSTPEQSWGMARLESLFVQREAPEQFQIEDVLRHQSVDEDSSASILLLHAAVAQSQAGGILEAQIK